MIKLNPTNFQLWKTRMTDYLYYKDLNEPVIRDNGKPSNMTYEK